MKYFLPCARRLAKMGATEMGYAITQREIVLATSVTLARTVETCYAPTTALATARAITSLETVLATPITPTLMM